ncbi:MAG: UDP-N-acetylglucosamine 2-epimerase (hydrolyzing) [Acidobacteriaceae bacterium]|nr:UDP-N-acetylglucosamine 2-epimerase (hydrolyzing) [Acidobacteriaceae bacterium]MBV9781853.1 UDP-N-acetylglucosamine 2-epimerase (hydrolyzing) [Acidobacteriaceae bacterium]
MSCRIAVLTTGRQDYGILRSTLLVLNSSPEFKLLLIAGGMHLAAQYGNTVEEIQQDGIPLAARLDWLSGPEPTLATQMAQVMCGMEGFLQKHGPSCLMLVGDRYETAAAALAATTSRVPIVHLHGGEESEGAFDNQLRHAITKMSHLHFVSDTQHAARVLQMGEAPESVHVVGAPGIDNYFRQDLPDRDELEQHFGFVLEKPVVVVTVHPATLGEPPSEEVNAVIGAMRQVDATYIITLPNSDPGGLEIRQQFLALKDSRPRIAVTEALGARRFFGLLRFTDALLGNSSSAFTEAPALGIPAVNVGQRQKGRLRAKNVVDARAEAADVVRALRKALDPRFRKQLAELRPPLADGRSGQRIVAVLRAWQPQAAIRKRFHMQSRAFGRAEWKATESTCIKNG